MKKRWLPRVYAALFGSFAALLALYPQVAADAARGACGLWANRVMPALFPYLVASQLLAACLPGDYFLIPLSMLGGSPAGARLISLSRVDKAKAQRLSALCATVSPLYVIGTLEGGYRMLLCHWLGVVVAWGAVYVWQKIAGGLHALGETEGFRSLGDIQKHSSPGVMKGRRFVEDTGRHRSFEDTGKRLASRHDQDTAPSFTNDLRRGEPLCRFFRHRRRSVPAAANPGQKIDIPQAIADSVSAMLSVCGCMVLFSVLSALANRVTTLSSPASAALLSVLEMAGGCDRILSLGLPVNQAMPILCAAISFGGFSIFLQNASFLKRKNVTMRIQLFAKIIHALAAYLICRILS